MSLEKIAIVTGANKGIGYAIVKGLCAKFSGKVYLTSRDVERGQTAVAELARLGFNPSYHQLDIDDQTSVDAFKKYLAENHGGIDILVNNAGMAFGIHATESFSVQAKVSVRINYFGTLRVSEALFPLLRPNAKVVNVSTSLAHLSRVPSEQIRKKFADPNLTVAGLNNLMNEFVRAAKEDPNIAKTWGSSAYGMSKVGMSALTIVHQRMFDDETPSRNIRINHVHPGYVATDMNNFNGVLSVEEGAAAPLYLALESYDWKGQFVWRDCTLADWFAPTLASLY